MADGCRILQRYDSCQLQQKQIQPLAVDKRLVLHSIRSILLRCEKEVNTLFFYFVRHDHAKTSVVPWSSYIAQPYFAFLGRSP